VLARRDSTVFFDWSTGSPGYSVPSDSFIVRWDGYVTVPAAGDYKFGAISDDGARIWVGDTAAPTPNMLDDWNDHAVPTTPLLSATAVNFAAGSLTKRIRIEYYDATAAAVMKLYAEQVGGLARHPRLNVLSDIRREEAVRRIPIPRLQNLATVPWGSPVTRFDRVPLSKHGEALLRWTLPQRG
jgi:hypothetical protein